MFVIFPALLEGRKVMFDGVEIRGVRRQKKQGGSRASDERVSESTFVEGRVIHDHDVGVGQERTEHLS